MKQFLFSLRDAVSETSQVPFCAVNAFVAVRSLKDVEFYRQHAEDYTLYCVGVFDTESGNLIAFQEHEVGSLVRLFDDPKTARSLESAYE